MKKTLLVTISVLAALSAQAQTIIDQWTFTNDPVQNSDIKGKSMNTWDPALAGNSLAGGVLTWGYVNTSAFQTAITTSGVLFQGSTWLGATDGLIPQLKLTIDAKDINFSENGGYGWEFTAGAGEIATGKVRSRIAIWNGNVSIKMEGTGEEWSSTDLYNQADYASITDLQFSFTWDFVNDTMSMDASGTGSLVAGGNGIISYSDTIVQDLTGVTNLTTFRTRQQGQGSSYIELDTVTIEVVPEPSTAGLIAGALALTSVMVRRRR